MKNKFIGFVCLIYCGIILFIILSNQMNNYLSPSMQKYIIISCPFLIFTSISLFISKSSNKFSIFDLILLLPLIILFFAGNGRLTTDFASNRNSTFKSFGNNIKKKNVHKNSNKNRNDTYNDYSDVSFDDVDFEIIDENYAGLSDEIVYNSNPSSLVGKTIRLRGFTLKRSSFLPKNYFGIGKYLISCCAADSSFGGFMAKINDLSKIKDNTWYEMEGVLELDRDTYNQKILVINVVNYKKINGDNEELYMYPCYAYGDGSCSEVVKYNLS